MPFYVPPTPQENWAPPVLEIKGDEDFQLISAYDLLPEEITVTVDMEPLWGTKTVIRLCGEEEEVLAEAHVPYPLLSAIRLHTLQDCSYLYKGHKTLFSQSSFHLDPSWSQEYSFSIPDPFVKLELEHESIPYGGKWDPDPSQCFQNFLYSYLVKGNLSFSLNSFSSFKSLSLAEKIQMRFFRLFLTFQDNSYPYFSSRYCIREAQKLIIFFTP